MAAAGAHLVDPSSQESAMVGVCNDRKLEIDRGNAEASHQNLYSESGC